MFVTSPGGYQYPKALPWDASATNLKLALEWAYDIGEVYVYYMESSNNTRSYRVTFEVTIRLQLRSTITGMGQFLLANVVVGVISCWIFGTFSCRPFTPFPVLPVFSSSSLNIMPL